jgi:TATA-box binding protein (TBP) (component of TFIID and TFIIIB)
VALVNTGAAERGRKAPESYNVFGTFKLGEVDLHKIAGQIPGAYYLPETSPSMDIPLSGCLFRIFPNGNTTCTGHTEGEVRRALVELIAMLRGIGMRIDVPSVGFHSQNFVVDYGKKIRMTKAMYLLKKAKLSMGAPKFLSYRPEGPDVTFEIFESGKIVCLGAKDATQKEEAFSHIMESIKRLGLASSG